MKVATLRQWEDSDLEPLADMNADSEVMRYFLSSQSRSESLEMYNRLKSAIDQRGWGVWAVEVDGRFAGMVGLHVPTWKLPFSPCTEVLWRLKREFWGMGIGYEAADQAMQYGFSKVGLSEIVAFTTPPNVRSIRLMQRLGMKRDHQGDFDHPAVPEGHPLRRHILFRKKSPNKAPEPTTKAVMPRAIE
jgi:RimJ/RimL family protein N-acetyltransferase